MVYYIAVLMLQTSADDGCDHNVLHADLTKFGFWSAMESCREAPRRHMSENLVEKLFVHP